MHSLQIKKEIAFALIMGMITIAMISFTLVEINVGFQRWFLRIWIRSWLIAFVIAVNAILFIGPFIQLFVNKLLRKHRFGDDEDSKS